MTDPERLMKRGATSFESRLLQAGRSDAMSTRSRRVIVSGLGLGSMLWAGGLAAAMQKAGKGWLASSALRYVGVAVLSGSALWAGVAAFKQPAPLARTPAAVLPATNAPNQALSAPGREPEAEAPKVLDEEPGHDLANYLLSCLVTWVRLAGIDDLHPPDFPRNS